MGLEVGVAISKVEPMTVVEKSAAEGALSHEFHEGRNHGALLLGWNEIEDLRVDAVNAGELMSARGDSEEMTDVDDLLSIERDAEGLSSGADSEGGDIFGGLVGCKELLKPAIGEDIAVVDENGVCTDPLCDVFDASAGFEEFIFVEKGEGGLAIASLGKKGGPGFGEVVGIDGEIRDSGSEALVEGVGDEGAVEDRDEGLGERFSEGAESRSESGPKEEGLAHGGLCTRSGPVGIANPAKFEVKAKILWMKACPGELCGRERVWGGR